MVVEIRLVDYGTASVYVKSGELRISFSPKAGEEAGEDGMGR